MKRIQACLDKHIRENQSKWIKSFDCSDINCLIICRGPVRLEAMQRITELGGNYGILLSNQDSIEDPNTFAPETRIIKEKIRIHRVSDYGGSTEKERIQRRNEIIHIAKTYNYNSILAGYGFMAEDPALAASISKAGLLYIGPNANVSQRAGQKDEAKNLAVKTGVSVVPGINDLVARALCSKAKNGIADLAIQLNLPVPQGETESIKAENLTKFAKPKKVELLSLKEFIKYATEEITKFSQKFPNKNFRLKAVNAGGGKGQRVILKDKFDHIPRLIQEIIQETGATDSAGEQNILVELNLESTRHYEIQLIGNGDWCISMGGRDCSVQMHSQKLIEVSLTTEELSIQEKLERTSNNDTIAALMRNEKLLLESMEKQAETFGLAVGLDSASTFECIVDGKDHYFMEMNTRIQVEHRISELCYALIFTNPEQPEEQIKVTNILAVMILIARHGKKLPKPKRFLVKNSSIEIRLNATDDSLTPHSGGLIENWSEPIKEEIRDDQAIGIPNPDTSTFIPYRLLGSYDSNIALIISTGSNRSQALRNISKCLEQMQLEGIDLKTNLEFQIGLVNWIISENPYARITTDFVENYLIQVSQLFQEIQTINFDDTYDIISENKNINQKNILKLKNNLIVRPLKILQKKPHQMAGWISKNKPLWTFKGNKFEWKKNPVEILNNLYLFLSMDDFPKKNLGIKKIWEEDKNLLQNSLNFYKDLNIRVQTSDWRDLLKVLQYPSPPNNWEGPDWNRIRQSHFDFQIGLDILALPFMCATYCGFLSLKLDANLDVVSPKCARNSCSLTDAKNILSPPPKAPVDVIVARSNGKFYSRSSPKNNKFVEKGDKFKVGDPLYIIEVMKMFNTVQASFNGIITEDMSPPDGDRVTKSQPLFKIKSDDKISTDNHSRTAKHNKYFQDLFSKIEIN